MYKDRASRLKRFSRWLRLQFILVVRENSTPARTGLGFALGAFIGIFPSFLMGTPIAFLLAGRFGWNRAAAAAGTFLTNPITAPLFFSLSAWLGLEMFGLEVETAKVHGVFDRAQLFDIAGSEPVPCSEALRPRRFAQDAFAYAAGLHFDDTRSARAVTLLLPRSA
jgi:uncharacterized protein (DUF2062 family)